MLGDTGSFFHDKYLAQLSRYSVLLQYTHLVSTKFTTLSVCSDVVLKASFQGSFSVLSHFSSATLPQCFGLFASTQFPGADPEICERGGRPPIAPSPPLPLIPPPFPFHLPLPSPPFPPLSPSFPFPPLPSCPPFPSPPLRSRTP